MYYEFDYKLQKSTLIVCIRWLAWKKSQIRSQSKWETMNK